MPLRKIGKYEVISELGKGAMGVVYKAQDPFLGRFVAIKTMSESLHDNKDLVQRFYREAQAAGQLRHPNIVTIYDLGEVSGMPFIAMELIEGQDLDEIIRSEIPFPLIKKLNIVSQICKGLDYAHEGGIVHRDIKPANVRILPDGKSVKIMDFGIARMSDSNMTRPGMVMGTVSYMSPEQITHPQQIDRRSDLFSVGVILYEFVTLRLPFSGDSIHAILTNIVHQAFTPLKTFLSSYPQGLEAILSRALAKNRDERFRNCAEMGREIDTLVEMLKPQAIHELLQTGQYELEQNNLDAAKRHYEDVISIQSTHDMARTFLRQIEERQGKSAPKLFSTGMSSSATIMPANISATMQESPPTRQPTQPPPPPPAPSAAPPSTGRASLGTIFCSSCGSRIQSGLRFCPQCGAATANLPASGATLSPPPPASPAIAAPIPEITPPARIQAVPKAASRAPLYIILLLVLLGGGAGGYYFFFLISPSVTSPTKEDRTMGQSGTTLPEDKAPSAEKALPVVPISPPTTQVLIAANSNNPSSTGAGSSSPVKIQPTAVPSKNLSKQAELGRERDRPSPPIPTVHKEATPIEVSQDTDSSAGGSNSLAEAGGKNRSTLIQPVIQKPVIESPAENNVTRSSFTSAPVPEKTAPEKSAPPAGPPPYSGPREGIIEWNGEVQKGDVVILEGASASSGILRGRLPGVPCLVDINGEKVAITESPGISNQWKRMGLRFDKKGKTRVTIHWQVLSHVR